ncbi:G-protein coupled receptor 182 [Trichosurus vulpecula]|uniref:G-protein coupled receptor 182 n=1 Tax=Trichosurus vulpecula TaxID=9337 RepID=UPI00186ADBA8|nr:G-protein coupled receptor 182 [Trichosurus vulpecula]
MSTSPSSMMGPSPSDTPSSMLFSDLDDLHNWTELIHFFNHTFSECEVKLSENAKRVVLFVLYLAIFVVGLVENLLVIYINWKTLGQGKLLNLYVFNMSVADLGIILSLPVWMLEVTLDYTWLWGSFFCRFTHYFYFANMYSSIFFLTCLSIDRYVTLAYSSPFWQQNQHRVRKGICAGVWILSALIPLPEVVHIHLIEATDPMCLFLAPFETYSTWALAVTFSTIVLGFLLPFPLMVIFNALTVYQLHRVGRPEARRHGLLVCAYVAVFVVCWVPYHVTLLLLTLHGNHIILHCYMVHVLYFFYDVIDCLSMLHCVANPILYNFLSPSFRSRLMGAVVHYIPKDQARKGRGSSSSSTTKHSIVITKEGAQTN